MNLQRWKRYASWIAVVAGIYWIFIFSLTHAPGIGQVGPPGADKLAHFSIFTCLAGLVGLVAILWWGYALRTLVLVWLVVAAYGVVDELSQLLVPGRTCSLADWFADALGGASGVAIIGGFFWLANRLSRKAD